jgi:hypothetical protein
MISPQIKGILWQMSKVWNYQRHDPGKRNLGILERMAEI